MKAISILFSISIAGTAMADQCAYNTRRDAEAAKELLKPGSQVVFFCEPCSDHSKKFVTVNSSEIKEMQPGKYYMVTINGRGTDLAYTFLKTKSKINPGEADVYSNMAKMVGCPAVDVSDILEVR